MFISFLFAYLCGVTFASNNFISGVTNGYVVATISRKTSKKLDEKITVFYYKEYLNESTMLMLMTSLLRFLNKFVKVTR